MLSIVMQVFFISLILLVINETNKTLWLFQLLLVQTLRVKSNKETFICVWSYCNKTVESFSGSCCRLLICHLNIVLRDYLSISITSSYWQNSFNKKMLWTRVSYIDICKVPIHGLLQCIKLWNRNNVVCG